MRQKCFVKLSEMWCFIAFGGVFQLHRSRFSTCNLTQHDRHASLVSYILWNSQEKGWDDSGRCDAAAWMARRREALLFQSVVHRHTPRDHSGTKLGRCAVASALHEAPALTAASFWNFWGEWPNSWSFQCQLLSWAASPDRSSLQQPRLQWEFTCPTFLWVSHNLSLLVPTLAAPWLSPPGEGFCIFCFGLPP